MSQPKTDTYDRLKKFMEMTPVQRDEALFLQVQRIKSHLESEGLVRDFESMRDIINGTSSESGLPVRVKSLEDLVGRLVKSNAKLQAAIYVATGIWIAVKFYFEFVHHA